MLNLYPGLVLNNHYQIQRPIGRGGFSTVWLAVDLRDAHSVAVKISLPEKDPGGEMPDRFERQFLSTRHLTHDHLLTALDFFRHEKSGCLVFDYMANGTLHDKVKNEGTLPEAEVAKLMNHIADALEHLHRNHLIHFDVKPENILINARGDYYLSDFDTASRLEKAMVRVSRIYADTPQYRSPEHLRGAAELSEKVDIFALGITLFELCEGIMEKEFGIGMMLLAGQEKPTPEPGKYAERLQQIIHACWNQSPADRPSGDALLAYSNTRLAEGHWPNVLEYNPNDRAFPNQPVGGRSSTARVTMSVVYNENQQDEPLHRSTELMGDRNSAKTAAAPPPPPLPPPPVVQPKPTPITPPQQPWSPPSPPPNTQVKMPTPPSQPENADKSMKWVPIILGALLLLGAGGFFGIRFLKNRKFEATLAEATKFRDAGKYKNALETCAIAQEMAGDLPEVKSLRFDILARARMQHEAVIAQVRAHFATAMPDSFALACQLLNYGAENASILKRGDSTAFYKALVCDLAPETPSETSEPPAPVPSEESKPKKEPKPTSEPKPTTEPQPKPTITQAEITARQQRAAQAQQKEDENQRKKEEAKQAKLDAAARKKAQQAAEEEAREVAKIKKEQEDEAARKKAEAERIKPAPAAATFKRDGNLLGVASSAYSGSEASCKALMGGQASVTLSPKETVRLERAYLAVNKCGTVRMKLVGPSGTMREVVTEVAGRGLAEMDFAGDFGAVKLEKGQQYTLSFSPAESEACAGKPQIESLSPSCGADSRDNSPQLAIKQNGGAFLFDLKYKY